MVSCGFLYTPVYLLKQPPRDGSSQPQPPDLLMEVPWKSIISEITRREVKKIHKKILELKCFQVFFVCQGLLTSQESHWIYIYICPWKSSFKGILRRPWETSLRCTFHWLWCFYWTWVSWSSRRFRETGGYENWDSVGLWRHGIQYSHKRPRRQNGRNTEFWCVEGFSLLMFVVSIWLHFMCHVCFYI